MCRVEPRLSAKTVAKKPEGSLSWTSPVAAAELPPESAAVESEAERLRSLRPQPSAASVPARSMIDFIFRSLGRRSDDCRNFPAPPAARASHPPPDRRGTRGEKRGLSPLPAPSLASSNTLPHIHRAIWKPARTQPPSSPPSPG